MQRFAPALRAALRAPPRRFNSTSTSTSTARVMQMAAHTARPSPAEAAVPLAWAACGALAYAAWTRAAEREDGAVEKLLIV